MGFYASSSQSCNKFRFESCNNMCTILTGLILMGNLDFPHAEYAKALSISLVHITVRDVLTKKVRWIARKCLGALLIRHTSIFCSHHPSFSTFTGICAMCGKKVIDTKNYKQTSVWFIIGWWRFVFSWEGDVCGCLCWLFQVLRMITWVHKRV